MAKQELSGKTIGFFFFGSLGILHLNFVIDYDRITGKVIQAKVSDLVSKDKRLPSREFHILGKYYCGPVVYNGSYPIGFSLRFTGEIANVDNGYTDIPAVVQEILKRDVVLFIFLY